MDAATGAMANLIPKLKELLHAFDDKYTSIRKDVHVISQGMKILQSDLLKLAAIPRGLLNEQAKLWREEVRELSYAMEQDVDELLGAPNSEGFKGFMERVVSLLKKGKTRHQILAAAVKDMMLQGDAVFRRFDPYKTDTPYQDMTRKPTTAAEGDLVGIDGKKDQLMKLLSDGDIASNTKLKIVSVVGFGGLGKTTLVKAVYDKIQRDFDCKAFVVAGQNIDVDDVFMDIISQLTNRRPYFNTGMFKLISELEEILENKRCLIVIDDIWDTKVWELIKCALYRNYSLGSRIITTTRIVSVSEACCLSANDSVYHMEPLPDDESKKLLYDRMFGSVSRCPHEFEQVSSDILKKCGGVPLAILAMASVLAGDLWMKPKDEWHVFLNSIGRGLTSECWENMQLIVSFSYYHVPQYLKTFLLYMSTFPGDHPIERDRLVKKCIVEGILTHENWWSLEGAASQFLAELINRNVIKPLECNKNCKVVSYHIHPVMHDVLKAIAVEEKFAASLDVVDISNAHGVNLHHLSIDCPDSENLTALSTMAFDGDVRSLTVFGHANQILLGHFKGIRILDLEGCKSIERADVEYICNMVLLKQLCLAKTHITELPPQIGNLQNLEGLDVGGTQITDLPPQIGKLQHLKTLDARKSRVKDLPDQIVRLTSLVHLLIGDNESCQGVKLPCGIAKLTSLQQLGTIDLRKCSASSLKEIGELPYLKQIEIVASAEPEDTRMNNALLSCLDKSANLRSLVVYSDFRLNTIQSSSTYKYLICRKKLTMVRRSLKVPIGFAEQSFLRMLDIRVCRLEDDDLKILRELPRLRNLVLRLDVLPTEMIHISCKGFAKLERFYVDSRMPRVIFEEGAMPKLEHLELKLYAGSASEKHMGIKHLRSLQTVTLHYARWYASNKGVENMTDAVKTEAKEHQNEITVCIDEEDKDGTCTIKSEIFQENKDTSCCRMAEIEEEKDGHAHETCYFLNGRDTQERGLH